MQSFFLERLNAFLRYLDFPGSSPANVYLHGLGCASSSDFPTVVVNTALMSQRSILVDLLGFGYSDGPVNFSYTLEDHAKTIAQLMDHLSLTNCGIIGHSLGGSIGITLASARPDLVSRLVLAEGNLDPGGGIISTGIASQSEEQFKSEGYRDLLKRALKEKAFTFCGTLQVSAPHAVYRSAVSLVRGTKPTMRERLLALHIPRTYIFGEKSLPNPDADRLATQGIQVLVVPNAGHLMMLDNPQGLAEVLKVALSG